MDFRWILGKYPLYSGKLKYLKPLRCSCELGLVGSEFLPLAKLPNCGRWYRKYSIKPWGWYFQIIRQTYFNIYIYINIYILYYYMYINI
jgi:hypothetical protein